MRDMFRIAAIGLCLGVSLFPQTKIVQAAAEVAANAVSSEVSRFKSLQASIPNITTEELKAALEANPNTVLIDVRTVREANLSGGIIRAKRSLAIPRGWLEFRIEEAVSDKDAPIVLYCATNRRSVLALITLKRMGYTNVKNYAAGANEWKAAGYPMEVSDRAPNDFLYALPQQVTSNVWTSIGQTAPSSYENSGQNNNLSFVVTNAGVVVFNGGGSWLLARSLHDHIKNITDKPVKFLVLENGQGHAFLGASYWKEQGVTVIAHEDAAAEIEEYGDSILASAQTRLRDKIYGTTVTHPDTIFTDKMVLELGGVTMELLNLGPAHSPGDIMLWMPKEKLVISGDMAFHQRMLPVFEHTDTAGWIDTWPLFENLGAEIVIPGHGAVTDMASVTKYTRDYLAYMRSEVQAVLDKDGGLNDAYKIDQSAYEHLDTYEFLALRNAARIFQAMEFE